MGIWEAMELLNTLVCRYHPPRLLS
jgi:hypothetical protein